MPLRYQPVAVATVVAPTVPARFHLATYAQPCRRQRACAAPAVRITNHESRITNHESRPFGPFRPSLVRGDTPRNAPLSYATVPAPPRLPCQQPGSIATVPLRYQPVAVATVVGPTVPARFHLATYAQPCRRQRACAAPAVRITNHESRPFGPFRPSLVRGTPPATPPSSDATVLARTQLVCQRPGGDATVCARFQLVINAPRTRCGRPCASPIPVFEFRRFSSSGLLSTALLKSGPAIPCKRL